jgi:hypothetical protein
VSHLQRYATGALFVFTWAQDERPTDLHMAQPNVAVSKTGRFVNIQALLLCPYGRSHQVNMSLRIIDDLTSQGGNTLSSVYIPKLELLLLSCAPCRPEQAVAAPLAQFPLKDGAVPTPEWLYAQLKLAVLQQQQQQQQDEADGSSSRADGEVLRALQEAPEFYQALAYELLRLWQLEVGAQASKENALPQLQEDVQQLLKSKKGGSQQQPQQKAQQKGREKGGVSANQGQIDDSTRVCYKCNRMGHISKNCPYGEGYTAGEAGSLTSDSDA